MTNRRFLTAILTVLFAITINGVAHSSMIHVGEYNNQDYYIEDESCYKLSNSNNYKFYLASYEVSTERNPKILEIQTSRESNQFTIKSAIIFQQNFEISEVPVQSTRTIDSSDIVKEVISILDTKYNEGEKSSE